MNAPTDEPSDADRKLEQLMDRTLRGLPPHRAPGTLELRVQRELERRAALPWWRHSFARWPRAARAVFVLSCVAAMYAGFVALNIGAASLPPSPAGHWLALSWAHPHFAILGALADLAASLARAVPPHWLEAALLVSALLYAALCGLGTAAYRAIYLNSDITGDIRP
jgi:hypothetical protein